MKGYIMCKKILAIVLSIALLTTMLPMQVIASATAASTTIEILSVDGTVNMTRGTPREFAARAGMMLHEGFTVTTGEASSAVLMLDDGSLVQMDSSSTVQIAQATRNRLSISLVSGNLAVDAETQRSDRTVEVRVGNTALGIRGTFFAVENRTDGSVLYTMFEGSGVVDGHLLPALHVIHVHTDDVIGYEASASMLSDIHELLPFRIEEASIFVLELILSDFDRFVELDVVGEDDFELVYQLFREQLEELRDRLSNIMNEAGSDRDDWGIGNLTPDSPEYIQARETQRIWLRTSVTAAESTGRRVVVVNSPTPRDIPTGLSWVTRQEYNEFANAIAVAQARVNSQESSLQQIADARVELLLATQLLEATARPGLRELQWAERPLHDAIVEATSMLNAVDFSQDGADVWNTRYWVHVDRWVEFSEAIYRAQRAILDPIPAGSITAEAAFVEFNILRTAREDFERLVRVRGSRVLSVSYVNSAIEHARYMLDPNNIFHSEDGEDVPADRRWIRSAERSRIMVAIAAAQNSVLNVRPDNQQTLEQLYRDFTELNNVIMYFTVALRDRWGYAPPLVDNTGPIRAIIAEAIELAEEMLADVVQSENGTHQIGVRLAVASTNQRGIDGSFLQYQQGTLMGGNQHWVQPRQALILQQAIDQARFDLDRNMNLQQAYVVSGNILNAAERFEMRIAHRPWGNLPPANVTTLLNDIAETTAHIISVAPISDSMWDNTPTAQLEIILRNLHGFNWGDRFVAERYWTLYQDALTLSIARATRAESAADVTRALADLGEAVRFFNLRARRIMPDFSAFDMLISRAEGLYAFSTLEANHPQRVSFATAIAEAQNARNTVVTTEAVTSAYHALNIAVELFLTVSGFTEEWRVGGNSFSSITAAMAAAGATGTARLISPIALIDEPVTLTSNVEVAPGSVINIASGGSMTVQAGRTLYVQSNNSTSTHGADLFMPGRIVNRGSFVTNVGSATVIRGDFENRSYFVNNGTFTVRTDTYIDDPRFAWNTWFSFTSDTDITNNGEMVFWGNAIVTITNNSRILGNSGAIIRTMPATGFPRGLDFSWRWGRTVFRHAIEGFIPSLGVYNYRNGVWVYDGEVNVRWWVRNWGGSAGHVDRGGFATANLAARNMPGFTGMHLSTGVDTVNSASTIDPHVDIVIQPTTALLVNADMTLRGNMFVSGLVRVDDGFAITGTPTSVLALGRDIAHEDIYMILSSTWGNTVFRDANGNELSTPVLGSYIWRGDHWSLEGGDWYTRTYSILLGQYLDDMTPFLSQALNDLTVARLEANRYDFIFSYVLSNGIGLMPTNFVASTNERVIVQAGATLYSSTNPGIAGDLVVRGRVNVAPGTRINGAQNRGRLIIESTSTGNIWGDTDFRDNNGSRITPTAGTSFTWTGNYWEIAPPEEFWEVSSQFITINNTDIVNSFNDAETIAMTGSPNFSFTIRLLSDLGRIGGVQRTIMPNATLIIESGTTLRQNAQNLQIRGAMVVNVNGDVRVAEGSRITGFNNTSTLTINYVAAASTWGDTTFRDGTGAVLARPVVGVYTWMGSFWMLPATQGEWEVRENNGAPVVFATFDEAFNHTGGLFPATPGAQYTITLLRDTGIMSSTTPVILLRSHITLVVNEGATLLLPNALDLNNASMEINGRLYIAEARTVFNATGATDSSIIVGSRAEILSLGGSSFIDNETNVRLRTLAPGTYRWFGDHWASSAPLSERWLVRTGISPDTIADEINFLGALNSALMNVAFAPTISLASDVGRINQELLPVSSGITVNIPTDRTLVVNFNFIMNGDLVVNGTVNVADGVVIHSGVFVLPTGRLIISESALSGSTWGATQFRNIQGQAMSAPVAGVYIWSNDSWQLTAPAPWSVTLGSDPGNPIPFSTFGGAVNRVLALDVFFDYMMGSRIRPTITMGENVYEHVGALNVIDLPIHADLVLPEGSTLMIATGRTIEIEGGVRAAQGSAIRGTGPESRLHVLPTPSVPREWGATDFRDYFGNPVSTAGEFVWNVEEGFWQLPPHPYVWVVTHSGGRVGFDTLEHGALPFAINNSPSTLTLTRGAFYDIGWISNIQIPADVALVLEDSALLHIGIMSVLNLQGSVNIAPRTPGTLSFARITGVASMPGFDPILTLSETAANGNWGNMVFLNENQTVFTPIAGDYSWNDGYGTWMLTSPTSTILDSILEEEKYPEYDKCYDYDYTNPEDTYPEDGDAYPDDIYPDYDQDMKEDEEVYEEDDTPDDDDYYDGDDDNDNYDDDDNDNDTPDYTLEY